ncbi:hypothetical protein [Vibrio sinaloensis]|uniref:hypothetical protein n=1 Tax=Photobacterium sp. (strain ATCC 43367) TaxID=379097 RepID=UPI00204CEF42|nr:hypothetical protein [Vibrio sinaloensis]UPQ86973.1 hypothetical protein MTO69_07995 [Vibrio sinaloensis]
MYPIAQASLLNYFDQLNYSIVSQLHSTYLLRHNRTELCVELDFSCLEQATLPKLGQTLAQAHKRLVVIDVSDIEAIGFDRLEHYADALSTHESMVIFEADSVEQMQKEVWLFLANDPRERDVFNESRYYRP